MTIHLVGLPHTEFDADRFSSCAFTAKSVRLRQILQSIGEDVIVYWGGSAPNDMDSDHFVSLMSDTEQVAFFGDYNPRELPAVEWDVTLPYWGLFNVRAIERIRGRIGPQDIIAIVMGAINQSVVDAFPNHIRIESGVGYQGICNGTHACFESYAWMHDRYGAGRIEDGRNFDAVIPNFQNPGDFELGSDEGYVMYLGRHIYRKGVGIAGEISQRAGVPLLTAGTGVRMTDPKSKTVTCTDGTVIQNATYVGAVGPQRRKELLSHATALIVPTLYIEPFGGVQVEAMMSGIPVIAPDYGVFTETLPAEWRYRMIREAVEMVRDAPENRGQEWRDYAVDRWSTAAIAPRYAEWLNRLRTLWDGGWYAE